MAWRDIKGIDNEEIYHQYQLLSLHGQSKDALAKNTAWRLEYDIIGPWFKCNMTDVVAGIGLAQMKRYKGLLARRKEIISRYDAAFKPLGIEVLDHYNEEHQSSGTPVHHQNPGNQSGAETRDHRQNGRKRGCLQRTLQTTANDDCL